LTAYSDYPQPYAAAPFLLVLAARWRERPVDDEKLPAQAIEAGICIG
jgi:hypothetical protein